MLSEQAKSRTWAATGKQIWAPSFSPTATTCSATPGASSSSVGDNEGFESPDAAAEWARTQTTWPDLDLSDGYAVAIVLGSEFNANQAVWEAWEGGEFPDAPRVHNYATDLGLVVTEHAVVWKHRKLFDRLKWR